MDSLSVCWSTWDACAERQGRGSAKQLHGNITAQPTHDSSQRAQAPSDRTAVICCEASLDSVEYVKADPRNSKDAT
jgi:hypothetical protein